ncbi:hypothetical protein LX32DRAFT_35846 [Colletotrichum zoysiae]|uniref:Uncharacterized protein n=1 Tax=Colletotrichum zoysiae TaxID=1216348 RepID=A0AAD9HDD3_9PEZI|nr:hypothetical protein LX32DRAFT_35846 [Colletotrichum zoysiae]
MPGTSLSWHVVCLSSYLSSTRDSLSHTLQDPNPMMDINRSGRQAWSSTYLSKHDIPQFSRFADATGLWHNEEKAGGNRCRRPKAQNFTSLLPEQ